jgi:hypothetical protein
MDHFHSNDSLATNAIFRRHTNSQIDHSSSQTFVRQKMPSKRCWQILYVAASGTNTATLRPGLIFIYSNSKSNMHTKNDARKRANKVSPLIYMEI